MFTYKGRWDSQTEILTLNLLYFIPDGKIRRPMLQEYKNIDINILCVNEKMVVLCTFKF